MKMRIIEYFNKYLKLLHHDWSMKCVYQVPVVNSDTVRDAPTATVQ